MVFQGFFPFLIINSLSLPKPSSLIAMNSRYLSLVIFLITSSLSAQTVGTMQDLSAQQKDTATSITLQGQQLPTGWNSDFRQLRDCCPKLAELDLSGCRNRELPRNALFAAHQLRRLVLPDSLERIGRAALYACDGIEELVIPASVVRIEEGALAGMRGLRRLTILGCPELGEMALAGLTGLREIEVQSPIPPRCAANTFAGLQGKDVQLLVPRSARRAYRQAVGWRTLSLRASERQTVDVDSVQILPIPQTLVEDGGRLAMAQIGSVVACDALTNERDHALSILNRLTTWRPRKGKGTLQLELDSTISTNPEAYQLHVMPGAIVIRGVTPTAVFWGLMTLEQMLTPSSQDVLVASLPTLRIEDAPRTQLRELMIDPARIFIPLSELRPFVVEMARYKLNALHLHLVDDQAWRMEIKSYPRLTDVGSKRTGMDDMPLEISGYYTQEEMREFVQFAARYHVDVIPEIEMPGHEVAAIHCYPQLTCGAREVPIRTTCGVSNELLCPGEEFVYEFLGNVFRELSEVFPSRYIHLGGDEAGNPALDCWTHCEKCEALKAKLGIPLSDRSENWRLQEYLFNRVIDTLRTCYGKTPMFWYETDFKRIPEGCITFAWRHGLTAAAIRAAQENGAHIMLCPGEHCYLDYPAAPGDMPEVNWGMPVTSLEQTYSLDPSWGFGEDFERNHLYGVAGTLWSECIPTPERLFYMTYPRAMALAEAGWSPQSRRQWPDFQQRSAYHLRALFARRLLQP